MEYCTGAIHTAAGKGRFFMLCRNCGTDNEPGAAFCHGCGTAIPLQSGPAPQAAMQICRTCGQETPNGMPFCQNCGTPLEPGMPPVGEQPPRQTPLPPPYPGQMPSMQQAPPPGMYNPWYQPAPLPESNGKAVAGMVLGILSLMAWILPLVGYPISITGLALSIKAKKETTGGIAKAGFVMSLIGLVLTGCNSFLGATLQVIG